MSIVIFIDKKLFYWLLKLAEYKNHLCAILKEKYKIQKKYINTFRLYYLLHKKM